jgi:hypothetical protein
VLHIKPAVLPPFPGQTASCLSPLHIGSLRLHVLILVLLLLPTTGLRNALEWGIGTHPSAEVHREK